MLLGRLPSTALLSRPEARPLAPVFAPFAAAVRAGDFPAFQRAVDAHEPWLLRRGLLLTLTYRLRPLLWRSLFRRVFLVTYVAPAEGHADSRKAATLELSHLFIAARYVQRLLEGWVPAAPHASQRAAAGGGVNPMLLTAVRNSAGPGTVAGAGNTTLTPPPGGPKALRPNEGLVWGNMPVTAEHVESVVAALVAQGLMHGFIAHSQGRFAIMGAKTRGAVAAGWPNVAEVTAAAAEEDGSPARSVPGLVTVRDV